MRRRERFTDRLDAGGRLATELEGRVGPDPVVLGLPRGGVPVAVEVARRLGCPTDVLVVRKVSHPSAPEFALGAVGESGVLVRNEDALARLGMDEDRLEALAEDERDTVLERVAELRPGQGLTWEGRDLVVVDDGIATGMTAAAALGVAAAHEPASLVLAVPVAPPGAAARLVEHCDDVVVLLEPRGFMAVGQWYDDFRPVSTEEVRELLAGRDADGRP